MNFQLAIMLGVYQLVVRLRQRTVIRIGKLGVFTFPAGYYVYTGSAMGGIDQRVNRHLRREKKMRWHIDYLLQQAEVVEVVRYPVDGTVSAAERRKVECSFHAKAAELAGARMVVKGFGASDCRCEAHLLHFEKRPVTERWPWILS